VFSRICLSPILELARTEPAEVNGMVVDDHTVLSCSQIARSQGMKHLAGLGRRTVGVLEKAAPRHQRQRSMSRRVHLPARANHATPALAWSEDTNHLVFNVRGHVLDMENASGARSIEMLEKTGIGVLLTKVSCKASETDSSAADERQLRACLLRTRDTANLPSASRTGSSSPAQPRYFSNPPECHPSANMEGLQSPKSCP
jgi:hypothetical protein